MRKRIRKQLSVEQEVIPSIAPGSEASAELGRSDVAEEHSPSGATDSSLYKNQYLEAVIASTSDAMITLDQQFRVRDLNSAAVSVLGGARENIMGRECSEVLCCKNLNRTVLCGGHQAVLSCACTNSKSHYQMKSYSLALTLSVLAKYRPA